MNYSDQDCCIVCAPDYRPKTKQNGYASYPRFRKPDRVTENCIQKGGREGERGRGGEYRRENVENKVSKIERGRYRERKGKRRNI